jgi:hypothetical protein
MIVEIPRYPLKTWHWHGDDGICVGTANMNERQHPGLPRRNILGSGVGLGLGAALSRPGLFCLGARAGVESGVGSPASPSDSQRRSMQQEEGRRFFVEPSRPVPIVEEADVVVCGAGPAGVSAAIAAARAGVRTRLIEARGCLGGIWTAGLLSWILDWQNKPGFMAELAHRLLQSQSAKVYGNSLAYLPERMKLLLEELCTQAGVRIRLHTRVSATYTQDNRIHLVVTGSKSGREAFAGKIFIDATGDGDLAAQAGCAFELGRPEDGRCQPMSMLAILVGLDPQKVAPFVRGLAEPLGQPDPKRHLLEEMKRAGVDPSYQLPTLFYLGHGLFCLMANHEYGVSAANAEEITQATLRARAEIHRLVEALRLLGDPWSEVQIVATSEHIGVREGRRIRGLYEVTAEDLRQGTQHEDAVCRVTFPIDVHAVDPQKEKGIEKATFRSQPYDIPYRALVARDVSNLLLAGRCISGDFIAHSSYRVTGNAVPMGETAGVAAALAVQSGHPPAEVPWSKIHTCREELRARFAPSA